MTVSASCSSTLREMCTSRAELALRDQCEKVARMRRDLPPGGELAKDYVFEELCAQSGAIRQVPFSDLFEDIGKGDACPVYGATELSYA